MTRNRLIAALDTADRDEAEHWASVLGRETGLLKLGLEFFMAHGPDAVAALQPRRVFLDLKLHDIPATVAGAMRALARLRPRMVTVHASGGRAMIAAARDALDQVQGSERATTLLAVTVLTSLDAASLNETGVADGPSRQVPRLTRLALEAGADGIVCSAHEAALLRQAHGRGPVLVVPGIRPRHAATDDQVRVTTPADAIRAGADWLVVGRPITRAEDPAASARAIVAEIDEAAR